MPEYRTALYVIWRSCERLGIRPPQVKLNWDDNDVITKAEILSYGQIRTSEEFKEKVALCGSSPKLQP